MVFKRVLLSFIAAYCVVHLMLSALWGPQGYFVNKKLQEIIPEIELRLDELEELEKQLSSEKDRLEADYQRILEEAYRYGYIQDDEQRIIFPSEIPLSERIEPTSEVVRMDEMPKPALGSVQISRAALICGIANGFLTLIISLSIKMRRQKHSKVMDKNDN